MGPDDGCYLTSFITAPFINENLVFKSGFINNLYLANS